MCQENRFSIGLKKFITDPEFKKAVENMGLHYEHLGPKGSEKKWLIDSQNLSKYLRQTGILDLIKAPKK